LKWLLAQALSFGMGKTAIRLCRLLALALRADNMRSLIALFRRASHRWNMKYPSDENRIHSLLREESIDGQLQFC
jgi:hypothetical protein